MAWTVVCCLGNLRGEDRAKEGEAVVRRSLLSGFECVWKGRSCFECYRMSVRRCVACLMVRKGVCSVIAEGLFSG